VGHAQLEDREASVNLAVLSVRLFEKGSHLFETGAKMPP
jgi:hypothetical protein